MEAKSEASFSERKSAETKSQGPAYGARKSGEWKTSFPKRESSGNGTSHGNGEPWYAPYVNGSKPTTHKKVRKTGGDR